MSYLPYAIMGGINLGLKDIDMDWKIGALLSATGLSWLFYFHALQKGPASLVSSIDKSSLAITVLLSFFILGERLSPWQWTGVAFMMTGVYLIGFKA